MRQIIGIGLAKTYGLLTGPGKLMRLTGLSQAMRQLIGLGQLMRQLKGLGQTMRELTHLGQLMRQLTGLSQAMRQLICLAGTLCSSVMTHHDSNSFLYLARVCLLTKVDSSQRNCSQATMTFGADVVAVVCHKSH